jgi:hypothetical protein
MTQFRGFTAFRHLHITRPLLLLGGRPGSPHQAPTTRLIGHLSADEEQRLVQAARAQDVHLHITQLTKLLVAPELDKPDMLLASERGKARARALARAWRMVTRQHHVVPPRLECLVLLLLHGMHVASAQRLCWADIKGQGWCVLTDERSGHFREYALSEEVVMLLSRLPHLDAHMPLLALDGFSFKRHWKWMCEKAQLAGLRPGDVSSEGNFRKSLKQLG